MDNNSKIEEIEERLKKEFQNKLQEEINQLKNATDEVQLTKQKNESSLGWNFTISKSSLYVFISHFIIVIIFIGICFLVGEKIYSYFKPPVTYQSTQDMLDKDKVKEIIKEEFNNKITNSQAERIVKTQYDSLPDTRRPFNIEYKEPDRVVIVPGKQVYQEAETLKKETKADVVITTDPAKPEEKPVIDEDKQYTLEQRSYKLYPDNLAGITVFDNKSVELEVDRRIKVFGNNAYIGASIMLDQECKKPRVGIKLLFPF